MSKKRPRRRQPPKPKLKGREAFKTLYQALERTRDSDGLYHPPAVEKERYPGPTKERNPKPKSLPKQNKKRTLPKENKNRWGRIPVSSLQSAGMPGNEETDPGPIRSCQGHSDFTSYDRAHDLSSQAPEPRSAVNHPRGGGDHPTVDHRERFWDRVKKIASTVFLFARRR
jgi:hypothetical protein